MKDRERSLPEKISELCRDVGAYKTEARAALDDSDYDVDRARQLLVARGHSGRTNIPGRPGYPPPPEGE